MKFGNEPGGPKSLGCSSRQRSKLPRTEPCDRAYWIGRPNQEVVEKMEVKSITEQKSLLATLSPGKRARLRRLLFEFGPGNGTLMLLPIDQGIEHGPRDFFPNPASKDPDYQFRLAAEAGYSALACQIGMASKYYPDYAGQVPLILKVNGKTDIPSSAQAFSTCNASVEDAVRLGADAVGYTLYVGSPR